MDMPPELHLALEKYCFSPANATMKIAATQNLASNENDYLDVADHFWRGVEEGILPPPFW